MENILIGRESIDSGIINLKSVDSLRLFLEEWDQDYIAKQNDIPLFDPQLTGKWSAEQKKYFAKVFYHARGHFHGFLWYMGNHAPDAESKKMVLHNIAEEFSLNGRSHEQLYIDFAKSLGADLSNEFANEEHHLPFIKDFNKGHLEWLSTHDWPSCMAAFSAYERLDNVDYSKLVELAKSLGAQKRGLVFFNVHIVVEHFETTLNSVIDIWKNNQEIIKEAFNFVKEHQITMWKNLSNTMFNYA